MKRIVKQAELSKSRADANLLRKIEILEEWLTQGIPYMSSDDGDVVVDEKDRKKLDFYPESLRQFKLWNLSENCFFIRSKYAAITSTGNDTLDKRVDIKEKVRKVLIALKEQAATQLLSTKASEFTRLKSDALTAKALLDIRNVEFREQQRKFIALLEENERLRRKLAGDAQEYKRNHDRLSALIATLKKELIALKGQTRSRMRLVKRGDSDEH